MFFVGCKGEIYNNSWLQCIFTALCGKAPRTSLLDYEFSTLSFLVVVFLRDKEFNDVWLFGFDITAQTIKKRL